MRLNAMFAGLGAILISWAALPTDLAASSQASWPSMARPYVGMPASVPRRHLALPQRNRGPMPPRWRAHGDPRVSAAATHPYPNRMPATLPPPRFDMPTARGVMPKRLAQRSFPSWRTHMPMPYPQQGMAWHAPMPLRPAVQTRERPPVPNHYGRLRAYGVPAYAVPRGTGYPPVAQLPGRYQPQAPAWSRAPAPVRSAGRGVGDPRFRPVRPHVAQRAMAPRWRPVAAPMPQPAYPSPPWARPAPAWARLQPMSLPAGAFGRPHARAHGPVPMVRSIPWGYGPHAAGLPRWHEPPRHSLPLPQPRRFAAPQRLPGWMSTEKFGANLPLCTHCVGG